MQQTLEVEKEHFFARLAEEAARLVGHAREGEGRHRSPRVRADEQLCCLEEPVQRNYHLEEPARRATFHQKAIEANVVLAW